VAYLIFFKSGDKFIQSNIFDGVGTATIGILNIKLIILLSISDKVNNILVLTSAKSPGYSHGLDTKRGDTG
jgi:hypothetical protein